MRILLDTNIVLDVLLEREPFVEVAKQVWQAVDNAQIAGYITASTITDIYYIVRKTVGLQRAHEAVLVCLDAFEICTVDRQALELAAIPDGDFEDNLQIVCATIANVDAIVTRDKAGFKSAALSILSPKEVLQQLSSSP
ncbi:MAG TPA: PIN domain-containing protein [Chloroflexia bacterium]|nr:PIN domain-containing protein [Chloroflexia bacterium]